MKAAKVTRDKTTPLFSAVIPGRCIVKKNGQRVYGRGRGKRVVYTPKFLEWQSRAMVILLGPLKSILIDGQVTAHFRFYFANRASEADVSNLVEGPQDALVKAGVLKDDKLVMRIIAEKFFGHEARVEIDLYPYEAGA
jgi:Holliday junction resolvase RusA-like endonuclease